jgi:nickel/cobalt transporter (NicO) family protein
MADIAAIIQSGASNPWLLLPTAVGLGALHAMEPGHSKSMMMAFIVAVRGTPGQAVLLGVAATVGHTIVVWALALLAWRLGDASLIERAEPWLLLLGGVLIVILGARILWRGGLGGHPHHHGNHQHPGHDHGHGRGHQQGHDHAGVIDAHAAAHEAEIQAQFAGRTNVTNSEVAWFGFTGGLLPCPSAFAVLLVCLHQKAYTLGVTMVAAFSLGLACTMVAVGVAASVGTAALHRRFSGFDRLAKQAPVVSAWIILVIGLLVVATSLKSLST